MMRKVIIMFFLTLFSFTTIAKANDNTSSVSEFANTIASVPGKLVTWFGNEVEKTKAYQKKVWSESKLFKTKKD